jgi:transposase-like protein
MRESTGRAYYDTKVVAGKSHNEAMRCLKRRLADRVWRLLLSDEHRLAAGPEGHSGATLTSSAAGSTPTTSSSDKSLPGPPPIATLRRPAQRLDKHRGTPACPETPLLGRVGVMSGGSSRRYPPELRERAVRMVAEISDQHDSEWAAISEGARLLGVATAETVRKWVRQAQVAAGSRPGTTNVESAEFKRLKGENAELRRANAILKTASAFLRGRARPATALITRFIADHQGHRDSPDGLRWGVERICRQLTELGVPIAHRPTTSSAIVRPAVVRLVTRCSSARFSASTPTTTGSMGPEPTVCQDTPSSAAIAEIVVRSIISDRAPGSAPGRIRTSNSLVRSYRR